MRLPDTVHGVKSLVKLKHTHCSASSTAQEIQSCFQKTILNCKRTLVEIWNCSALKQRVLYPPNSSAQEFQWVFPQPVISFIPYNFVPLITPHFTLRWTLTPMSTASPPTQCISIIWVLLCLPFSYHKALQSFFASSYLHIWVDPERILSHMKSHTAHSSSAGKSGMRNTRNHSRRLSMFHCRLPREEKKDALIPNVVMQHNTSALLKRQFCLTMAKKIKNSLSFETS